jgi:ABC-type multidrug transport system fused ATPase/permease subunit
MREHKSDRGKSLNVSYKQLFSRAPKLWRFMSKYRSYIAVLLALNLIRVLLISIPPLVTTYLIDEVVPKKDLFSLNILIAAVVVLYVTAAALRMTNIYIRSYLGAHISYDIRSALYNALLNQSPMFYAKRATGEVTSRLNNDVKAVQYLASQALFELTATFLQIFVSLGFLFYLSWKVASVILGLTVLMYVFVSINMSYHKKLRKSISERWGKLLGFLQEVISNIRIVKAFCAEKREETRHLQKSRQIIIDNIRMGIVGRMFWVIGTLFGNLIFVSSIVFGVYLISRGEVTVGLIFAFVFYINIFLMPIFGLSGTISQIVGSFVSVDRIHTYIEAPNPIAVSENPVVVAHPKGELSFRDVVFGYDDDGPTVLNGVSLEIREGESVAFVGHSGAGKTTMMNIILRYYDPTSGSVHFNGVDLRDLELDAFRDNISIVFQNSVLFNDTILDNLRYAKEDATLDEVEAACRDANIEEFVHSLPQKYDTIVGERGVKLSGGQRQRLCIARGILKNPRILLLDEATASVDSISENRIQDALDKIMRDRTTILIAHRLSTITHVDRIYALENGRIAEAGSHEQLLRRNGLYARLWTTQMKERTNIETHEPVGDSG